MTSPGSWSPLLQVAAPLGLGFLLAVAASNEPAQELSRVAAGAATWVVVFACLLIALARFAGRLQPEDAAWAVRAARWGRRAGLVAAAIVLLLSLDRFVARFLLEAPAADVAVQRVSCVRVTRSPVVVSIDTPEVDGQQCLQAASSGGPLAGRTVRTAHGRNVLAVGASGVARVRVARSLLHPSWFYVRVLDLRR